MKRILIVLEKLDIGGIETYVLNQTKAFTSKGIEVYIMAHKGIYTKKYEEAGAKLIEYKFEDSIYFSSEKINNVIKIIKENKITEVHINQFPAMSTVMPACILTNTPYIAYLHMASSIINDPVNNAYNYFETQYITYKKYFEMFFKYASKIIAITEEIKNYTAERYNIDKSKIIVRPNSINFDDFKTKTKINNIENILLITRLSCEKKISIINGLELYKRLKENLNINLKIAGDGPIKEEIEKYIEEQNISDVEFLGSISNVNEVMDESDLVIGVDRCILEALSLNKIAVISGYDGLKGIVNKENLPLCIKENFCGRSLKNTSIEKVEKQILKFTEKDIEKITKENYSIISKKLDIYKNVYTLEENISVNKDDFIKDLFILTETLGTSYKEYHQKADEIWKLYVFERDRNIINKPFFQRIKRVLKKLGFKRK